MDQEPSRQETIARLRREIARDEQRLGFAKSRGKIVRTADDKEPVIKKTY